MKTDKIVQKLVDSYGSWVQEEKENCPGHCAVMSKELYPYDAIFSPIRVNRITLKNRVVMAPMGNLNMCEENGRPSDKMLQYFFARAKGGTGLLTTGLIPISHGIDNTVTEPGKLSFSRGSTEAGLFFRDGGIWHRVSMRTEAAFSSSSPRDSEEWDRLSVSSMR